MKKIIIILSLAILIIPFFPVVKTHASSVKDQNTPGTINSVKQKAIFYAVSEKSGITFSGPNGGADNFFDALRQTNYEMYKNDNPKLTKNGLTPKQRFEKVAKEFTQKPKKIAPGLGKITLSSIAFSYVNDMVLNSFEEWAYGLSIGHQVKVFDKWIASNSSGQSMAEMPGLLYFTTNDLQNGSYPDRTVAYNQIREDGTVFKLSMGGHWKPGQETSQINFVEYMVSNKKDYAKFLLTTKGIIYNSDTKLETASREVLVPKGQMTAYENAENPVVANKEPKSLGTLNPPSWDTGDETSLPSFIELEVPITEDGEMDLDRQLSPDNPAVNDPKKPLRPVAPDYTVPDEEDTEDPTKSPILTPRPTPETNPLPEANPLPETSTPTEPGTPPSTDDPPVTKPGDTQNRWGQLVTTKFPFSLPWDIGKMISPLMADPKRPSVKVDKQFEVFGSSVPIKFSHNFAWMDDYIVFFRTFILIGFNIFLITGTRKLMGGGQ